MNYRLGSQGCTGTPTILPISVTGDASHIGLRCNAANQHLCQAPTTRAAPSIVRATFRSHVVRLFARSPTTTAVATRRKEERRHRHDCRTIPVHRGLGRERRVQTPARIGRCRTVQSQCNCAGVGDMVIKPSVSSNQAGYKGEIGGALLLLGHRRGRRLGRTAG